MNEKLQEAMDRATMTALEGMFFAAVLGPAQLPASAGTQRAEVAYSGSRQGRLSLEITDDALANISSAFLGADAVEDLASLAVFLELTNVVCGSMLSAYDPAGTFTLSPPRIAGDAPASPPVCTSTFELDVGVLRVSVSAADHAEPA